MSKIIYTYGVFDLFHVGHLRVLQQARSLGSILVVGIFTDKVAESFKRKPIIPERERREIIKSIYCVDEVVYQDEFSPQKNIDLIKPTIVAKASGADWEEDNIPQFKGAESILLKYTEDVSTSRILKDVNAKSLISVPYIVDELNKNING